MFRAAGDAEAAAARLADLGFDTALAPVIAPAPLDATAPEGRFDAVAATSAKALEYASENLLRRSAEGSLHVVGSAGLRAARRRELDTAEMAPDAASLARLLVSRLRPGARLLYLAGLDRKKEFEAELRAAGIEVTTVEVYVARERLEWLESEVDAVKKVVAALHYSRRSAELATRLAEAAGLAEHWGTIAHVVISEDAAGPLRDAGVAKVRVAESPDEPAMLEILRREVP